MDILKRRAECCEAPGPSQEPEYQGIEEGAMLFKALGDETRLSIVRRLAEAGELCACDLACCGLTQPTMSHHLKVLREAGIVTAEKRGLWVHYSLKRDKLDMMRAWLP